VGYVGSYTDPIEAYDVHQTNQAKIELKKEQRRK
jgi:hypothetical protein